MHKACLSMARPHQVFLKMEGDDLDWNSPPLRIRRKKKDMEGSSFFTGSWADRLSLLKGNLMFHITIEKSRFIPVTRGLSPTSRVRVAGIVYITCEQKGNYRGKKDAQYRRCSETFRE